MKIKTFIAHGDVEGMEDDINEFLATLSSAPLFTQANIDEHRVFVMIGYDEPPAATTEPVGTSDPTAAPPPTDAPPAAPTDAPATDATASA